MPRKLFAARLALLLLGLLTPGTLCLADDFRRGDSNTDGRLDLSDAVGTLGFLFLGGAAPSCEDASDADDSGVIDITDAIASLTYLFSGGDAPPAPGADNCGADPTADTLDCASYPGCDGGGGGDNETVEETLEDLVGLDFSEDFPQRVDDMEVVLEDFSPLGSSMTMNRPEEILIIGASLNVTGSTGDGAAAIVKLLEPDLSQRYRQNTQMIVEWDDHNAPYILATPLSGSAYRTRHAAAGDIDGDGVEEVVVARIIGGSIAVEVTGDAVEGFREFPRRFFLATATNPVDISVAAGDFDGDGVDEIAVVFNDDNDWKLLFFKYQRSTCEREAREVYEDCLDGPECTRTPDFFCGVDCSTTHQQALIRCQLDLLGQAACIRRAEDRLEACQQSCIVNSCAEPCRVELNLRLDDCASVPPFQLLRELTLDRARPNGFRSELAVGNFDRDLGEELAVVLNGLNFRNSCRVLDDASNNFNQLLSTSLVTPDDRFAAVADPAFGDVDGDGVDELILAGLRQINTNANCDPIAYVAAVYDDARTDMSQIAYTSYDRTFNGCEPGERSTTFHYVFTNAGDLDGDGRDEVSINDHIFDFDNQNFETTPNWRLLSASIQPSSFMEGNGRIRRFDRSTMSFDMGKVGGDERAKILVHGQGQPAVDVYGFDEVHGWQKHVRSNGAALLPVTTNFGGGVATHPQVLAVNTTPDRGVSLRYIPNSHRLIYTAPVIHAVMAAPPCYTDEFMLAGQMTPVQSPGDCLTGYGTETGSSNSSGQTLSVSASLHAGFEGDFSLFGVGGKAELEATVTAGLSETITKTYTTSVEILETGNLNTVIFSTLPYDQYLYEIVSAPASSPDQVGGIVTVSLPRRPISTSTDFDTYNRALPAGETRLGENVFGHQIGSPRSYPTSESPDRGVTKDVVRLDAIRDVTPGQGVATATTFRIGEAIEEGSSFSVEASLTVKGSVNSVMAGFSIGGGVENNLSHTVSRSTLYYFKSPGIHPQASSEDYSAYSYKMFAYVQTLGDQEFEVLNYAVRNLGGF